MPAGCGYHRAAVERMADRLLITGGSGFVGRHLRARLDRLGIPYAAPPRSRYDLADLDQARALCRDHPDTTAIIHLACVQAAGDFPARHTAWQLDINSRIHLNLLAAWHQHLPRARLLAVGSSCAYPPLPGGLREEQILDGAIHGSVYAYAQTKRLLLTGLRAYADQYGLDGSFLIPATMFGEYDDFHPATAHVVGALIGKFVAAAVEGHPAVEVWGDGTQVRDFLDVEDFVSALLHLLPRCRQDVVNIGSGRGISIRQLAEMIRSASGFAGRIDYRPTSYVGVAEKYIDVTRLREKYGWTIAPDLEPAIRRTTAWYRAHYAELRGRVKFPPKV
jgi:GDP-L-fucose synthase